MELDEEIEPQVVALVYSNGWRLNIHGDGLEEMIDDKGNSVEVPTWAQEDDEALDYDAMEEDIGAYVNNTYAEEDEDKQFANSDEEIEHDMNANWKHQSSAVSPWHNTAKRTPWTQHKKKSRWTEETKKD